MGSLTRIEKRQIKNELIRPEFTKGVEWIIADQSGSMGSPCDGKTFITGQRRRIDALNDAINSFGDHIQTIAFSDNVELHKGHVSLIPLGGTNLTKALMVVQKYEPNYIIVISDGAVNDELSSEHEARHLSAYCIIDTLYIGPDDAKAVAFMKRLSEIGSGRFKRYDITKPQQLSLTQVIQGLLPAPSEVIET